MAYTLLLRKERSEAELICSHLEKTNQVVPDDLRKLLKGDRQSIGLGNFSMEINMREETKKQKQQRAMTDKSGVGYDPEDHVVKEMPFEGEFETRIDLIR